MPNPDRLKTCREHGAGVPDSEWNYHINLCHACVKKLAGVYGINPADVGAVETAKLNLTGRK